MSGTSRTLLGSTNGGYFEATSAAGLSRSTAWLSDSKPTIATKRHEKASTAQVRAGRFWRLLVGVMTRVRRKSFFKALIPSRIRSSKARNHESRSSDGPGPAPAGRVLDLLRPPRLSYNVAQRGYPVHRKRTLV